MGTDVIAQIEAQEAALQLRVQARAAAVEALRGYVNALQGAGFSPHLTYSGDGVWRVKLDLGSLVLPSGLSGARPDLVVVDEVAVGDLSPAPDPNPEPAPAVEAARKPAIELAPEPATEYITGPWSEAEERTALQMLARGKTAGQIAAKLNRPVPRTQFKLRTLRQVAAVDNSSDVSLPETPESASVVVQVRDDVQWTPALDLELCEAVFNGVHLTDLAVAMDIPDTVLSARWHSLFPDGATRKDQSARIDALRAKGAGDD